MNELKIIIRYTKYAIPILTFLSLSKLVLYYSLFDIQISDYIGLDEILTPFISDALKYLFFYFIPALIFGVFFLEKIGRSNVESYFERKKLTRSKRFAHSLKQNRIVWIGYSIITVALIIYRQPIEYILSTVAYIPMFLFILWIREEFLLKKDFEFTEENSAILNISTLLIMIFVMTISNTFLEVYRVKYTERGSKEIRMTAETIICRDSISYIGRTQDFTFIYNKNSKASIVIDNKDIKSISNNQ